jgi:hypothetical protein
MAEPVQDLSQTFVRRDANSCIALIVSKVVDNFTIAWNWKLGIIASFQNKLSAQFDLLKVVSIKFSTLPAPVCLSRTRDCKHIHARLRPRKISSLLKLESFVREDPDPNGHPGSNYWRLAGAPNFLGRSILTQASSVSSIMLQKLGQRKVLDLRAAADIT